MRPKRMILCDFPNNKCNLKCEYCYLSQIPDSLRVGGEFKYSIEHIAKCSPKLTTFNKIKEVPHVRLVHFLKINI